MLPRETLIGILSSLPDSQLVKSLDAAGIHIDAPAGSGGYLDGMDQVGEDDGLPSWNATSVQVPASKRSPIADTAQITAPPTQPKPQQPNYFQQDQPDQSIAPFAATA